ncbi:MAG: hypothetical protein V1647_06425, partial [Pseudomonadota bacterium]
ATFDENTFKDLSDLTKAGEVFKTDIVSIVADDKAMAEFTAGADKAKYIAKLGVMEKYVQDSYKAIDDVDPASYSTDQDVQDLVQDLKDYKKAETDLMDAKIAEKENLIFPDKKAAVNVADYKNKLTAAKQKFETKTKQIATDPRFKDKLEEVYDILNSAKDDLKVEPVKYSADDVLKSIPASPKKAKNFIAGFLSDGTVPIPIDIEVEEGASCTVQKALSAVKAIASPIVQIACSNKAQKKGLYDSSTIKCLSYSNAFLSPEENALNTPYIKQLQETHALNMAMATKNSGISPSLSMDGTTPTSPFGNVSISGTGTGGTGTGTQTSPITTSGMPTDNKFTAQSATTNFFNPAGTGVKNVTEDASKFYKENTDYIKSIFGYNADLTNLASLSPKVAEVYQTSATQTQNDLANISGGRYGSNQNSSSYIKDQISQMQNNMSNIITQKIAAYDTYNANMFLAKYGSMKEQLQAKKNMMSASFQSQFLDFQAATINNRINTYVKAFGPWVLQSTNDVSDTYYMYAQAGNTVPGKRALKIKDITTPVKYQLKQGWQEVLRVYVKEMMEKAEQTKREMNESRSKIKDLLSKKIKLIPLEKLPSLQNLNYEISNMATLRKSAIKNMKAIDKAMAYHRSKGGLVPKEEMARYEAEEKLLKKSMGDMVKTIDSSSNDVNRAQALLADMYIEIPKAEALTEYARKLVAEGR